ncbi:WxL domain-containing protein [Carnobacterium gallinarum]|uniref:WxL domain-containing protein n=1 Tax=Carnobacterium gallinarum TaxID=2749 RepID=UPI000553C6E8|nr:WxL domain-containing protein [Carnobacterium gallinarum]
MKLTKVAVIALVASVGLTGLGLSAEAATTSADTTGKVQFKAPTDPSGPTVKPDTPDEEITTDTGNLTTGTLRMEHVPDFDFGSVFYRSGSQEFWAKNEGYKTGAVQSYIPNFVQVTDERGAEADWNVSVSATVFTADKGTATEKRLDNTSIQLREKKLTNNVYDYAPFDLTGSGAETATRLEGFDVTSGTIPTTGSLTIFGTKAGANTEGSKSSIVFNTAYTEGTSYSAPEDEVEVSGVIDRKLDGKNSGVVLVKPASDRALVGKEYVSTLTWTVSSSI